MAEPLEQRVQAVLVVHHVQIPVTQGGVEGSLLLKVGICRARCTQRCVATHNPDKNELHVPELHDQNSIMSKYLTCVSPNSRLEFFRLRSRTEEVAEPLEQRVQALLVVHHVQMPVIFRQNLGIWVSISIYLAS